ncbi:IS110 family transposase [Aerococcaceae bacterium zg-ZJ1578]|uniref:transposase n=1 Tax=Aerococcaceae bacterium zg-252 TaxID=2796928 RepID=UPI001A2DA0FD|nr:IS110 family transposase [Aerococcaceae bacterium zg-1578]
MIQLDNVISCIHGKVKARPEELLLAMEGKLTKTDRYLLSNSLEEYRLYTKKITEMEQYIQQYCLECFPEEYALLQEIPGVKANTAAVILGEIGPDVTAFATEGQLASWAGVAPGSYESAGIKKSSRTTRGNKYLKTALVMSGGIAAHSKDDAFSQLFYRLANKGSKMKARVACAHKLLRIIYKVLSDHVHYNKQKALGLRQQALALQN